jgi:hypothetical protein
VEWDWRVAGSGVVEFGKTTGGADVEERKKEENMM